MPTQVGQTAIAQSNAGNSSTAGPIATNGATLLLVAYAGGAGIGAATIVDTFGNTWHFTPNLASSACNSGFFYSFDKAGAPLATGAAHSVTVGNSAFNAITFSAFSGTLPNQVNPINNLIGVIQQVTSGSLVIQPGVITPPGGSLVATLMSCGNCISGQAASISTPFTISGNQPTLFSASFGIAVAFSQSQSPVNPLWTFSGVLNPSLQLALGSTIVAFQGAATTPIFLVRKFQLSRSNRLIDMVEMGFDFSQSNSIMVKVDSFQQLRGVKLTSVFIDLSQSDSPITITDNVSGANVEFLGRSQGWVPLLFNEPMQFTVAFKSGLQATQIILRFSSDIVESGPWRTQ